MNTETKPAKRQFPAFFARHDNAVANGSFEVVRRTRTDSCRSVYMNGDFIQTYEAPRGRADQTCAELLAEGLTEYSERAFLKIAPQCVGGRGSNSGC
jgi:hypothetical protein